MSKNIVATNETAPETPSSTSPKKFNFNWPSGYSVRNWLWKFFKALGRIGAGAILMFALASFVPALREEMPSFYRLIDCIIVVIEWVYTQFWAIIT